MISHFNKGKGNLNYLDFIKICESLNKKRKDIKIGKYICNCKTHTLTDDKGDIIEIENKDELENLLINEFEPILFYIADNRDGGFRSTVITPNLKDVSGEILKLYKVVARCPSEVLKKKNEWEEVSNYNKN